MAFDSKPEYLALIVALSDTPITRDVQTDHVSFGSTKVQFYGSEATVTHLGQVQTALKILPAPNALRRFLGAIGIYSYDAETHRALSNAGVFTTPQGQSATEVHSQEITLAFPIGQDAAFDIQGVGSRGLHHLRVGARVTAVFASTGSDLVPFAIRCGFQWHLLWNGILNRLVSSRAWGLGELEVRLKGHSGYIVDTLR
jgi:hypothetical protein